MNLHYTLFNSNRGKENVNYYTASLASFKNDVLSKCKDTENEKVCMDKLENAFDFTFDVLATQLHREKKLDLKYEAMDKFKTLRGDPDRKFVPNN